MKRINIGAAELGISLSDMRLDSSIVDKHGTDSEWVCMGSIKGKITKGVKIGSKLHRKKNWIVSYHTVLYSFLKNFELFLNLSHDN